MGAPEKIKDWLTKFDSIIEWAAADPELVKQDQFLRGLFETAFPPEGLPVEIKFKSADGQLDLDEIAGEHKPYYLAEVTTTTVTPRSGKTKTTSQLVLKLKDSTEIKRILVKRGLLSAGAKKASAGTPRKATGKRNPYVRIASTLEKLVRGYELELAQVDALAREAEERGDARSVKSYSEERGRIQKNLELARQHLAESEGRL
jgi:hypothetical protein